jgi:hypothetical protein
LVKSLGFLVFSIRVAQLLERQTASSDCMFGLFKKRAEAKAVEEIAHRPPGQIFQWPRGTVLTALDEATIALPMAIFGKDEPIGSVVIGPADMLMNIPKTGDTFLIRVQPGMSVSLAKSCQARVVADDKQPRRFKISGLT